MLDLMCVNMSVCFCFIISNYFKFEVNLKDHDNYPFKGLLTQQQSLWLTQSSILLIEAATVRQPYLCDI